MASCDSVNPQKNSSSLPEWVTATEGGTSLLVHVQPGAKKDAITGNFNGRLKISLSAPPVDGKANERLIRWLSKKLGLPRSSLTLVSGLTSRDKRLLIRGIQPSDALQKLF